METCPLKKEMEDDKHDLGAVWDLLHSVDKKLDAHITQYGIDAPNIRELSRLLDRSKGILIFLTWISAIFGAGLYVWTWVKNHVTL